ncbi:MULTISPECIES: SHOCT domain-containing protein [Haloarcula]|uniref:SHOCT domain-containing protein n=1 Tax=Haloarcula TaxID=2237 RepID=UPI0023E87ECA|nr:SHOCT domain-containing protein [Halomicroarcula sp. SHR3]
MVPSLGTWRLAAVVTVLSYGFAILLGLFGLPRLAAALFVVGFLIATPLVLILGTASSAVESSEMESAPLETADEMAATTADTPIATLRGRYAQGELTDEEFERRLERLVETERLADRERELEL